MHCGEASNYKRIDADPDMGFDEVYLGREAFTFSKSGNRPWRDCDNYQDMINVYESCDGNPRFMYLLTYQNHGGYEQNDASHDTIRIANDYGNYTDDINEYLTSVDASADAFLDLIRYFENAERPVMVVMLGDHPPAFVSSVFTDKGLSGEEQEFAKRAVPYYIWSNVDFDHTVFSPYVSMIDVLPLMLKSAEMPLTGYYKSIVELNAVVPVRTSTGMYMDSTGTIG